jgi:lysophospholipase L1-like esterase
MKKQINPIQAASAFKCIVKSTISLVIISVLTFWSGITVINGQAPAKVDTLKFVDGQSLTIIGKYHSEKNYARFPKTYENKVRQDVWDLGQDAAGISIRFRTNAKQIVVHWTTLNDNVMDHMAFTGIKGVDLYAYLNNNWKYVNTARVKGKVNSFTLVKTDQAEFREYLLNLPLYDGIDSLSIGVNLDAEITRPVAGYLVTNKPIVYYGSSITQGGCASRPGMAFTNIIERAIDRTIINMGFSGSGTFDIPVAEAMSEIDASLYVIDCNPNTHTDQIYERAVALVKYMREKRPEVPILLVEAFHYVSGLGDPKKSGNAEKNIELLHAYNTLKKDGISKLYYKKADGFIGDDFEGTVDGVHPNDLGMMRIAKALEPTLTKLAK